MTNWIKVAQRFARINLKNAARIGIPNGTGTPTADIYFLNAFRQWVSSDGSTAITRLGPNLFTAAGRLIAFRYLTADELAILKRHPGSPVFYVIDDHLEAICKAHELPNSYRQRTIRFVSQILPRILDRAPAIVAPNARILETYRGLVGHTIEPSYCSLCTDYSHFASRDRIDIVYAGTRSHRADIRHIASGIVRFLDEHPTAHLTTFQARRKNEIDLDHPRIRHLPALDWQQYRKALKRRRFHLAIAPYAPTPLNQARSHNKLHDHAAFGAAGLYGDIEPFRSVLAGASGGLTVAHEPDAWYLAMKQAVSDWPALEALARGGRRLSQTIGDPVSLAGRWSDMLDMPLDKLQAGLQRA